ncbi:hypothetical protein ACH4U5_09055 [Streptomyces sp. NPDC020858]|uniref:hypothetical protein n=1 Tax=Streptomyces sp. NPDC020858 TaxID=3365097 RepID=UPI0037B9B4D2
MRTPTLAGPAAGEFAASVNRLTAPGTVPPAVLGEVRVIERFRSGSGGLLLTPAWPARLRGTAATDTSGVVRHAVAYAGPGEECVCRRHVCGGIVPASCCPEHGNTAAPAMEWHPGGGIRCADLALGRLLGWMYGHGRTSTG